MPAATLLLRLYKNLMLWSAAKVELPLSRKATTSGCFKLLTASLAHSSFTELQTDEQVLRLAGWLAHSLARELRMRTQDTPLTHTNAGDRHRAILSARGYEDTETKIDRVRATSRHPVGETHCEFIFASWWRAASPILCCSEHSCDSSRMRYQIEFIRCGANPSALRKRAALVLCSNCETIKISMWRALLRCSYISAGVDFGVVILRSQSGS